MAKNFLLEIGLEEMPAHVVLPSMNQLKEYVYSKNVGDIVMLTVKKNNKTFEISSKLAKNK